MANVIRGLKEDGSLPTKARAEVEAVAASAASEAVEGVDPGLSVEDAQALVDAGLDSRGLLPDGSLPTAAREQVVSLIGENPSVDEDQVRQIVDQRFAEQPPVEVTEESVIKALGFRTVVSTEPPAESTYTLSDGTVVRVVWQKPLDVFVPVVPEEPYWSDIEGTVLVPSLVGVEYRLVSVTKGGTTTPIGVTIPGGTPFSWSGVITVSAPYDLRVEALALPGYTLPSEFAWTHSAPDPDAVEIVTSDSFGRADAWAKVGDLTDATNGGASLAYSGKQSITIDGGPASSFRVEDNRLVKKSAVEIAAAGGTRTDTWNSLSLNAGAKNVRVSFDLDLPASNPTVVTAALVVSLVSPNTAGIGGVSFTFNRNGNYSLSVDQGVGVVGQNLQSGRYVLERRGSTITVTVPGEAPLIRTVNIDDSTASFGTWVGFRDNHVRTDRDSVNNRPNLTYSIDNLLIEALGV